MISCAQEGKEDPAPVVTCLYALLVQMLILWQKTSKQQEHTDEKKSQQNIYNPKQSKQEKFKETRQTEHGIPIVI